jgi:hypothetical protein
MPLIHVVMRPVRPMSTQKPQAPPRLAPLAAIPANLDLHAALAALLAALAGCGMALPQAADPVQGGDKPGQWSGSLVLTRAE